MLLTSTSHAHLYQSERNETSRDEYNNYLSLSDTMFTGQG